jgi:hypothetical protein
MGPDSKLCAHGTTTGLVFEVRPPTPLKTAPQ